METTLQGSHKRTYEAIFQHPIARNLEWREVCSMLSAMPGFVQEEHDGTCKVRGNGQSVVLHRPFRKNITDVRELMNLRRFLENAQTPVEKPPAGGTHLL